MAACLVALDMQKAYERVLHFPLLRQARALGAPENVLRCALRHYSGIRCLCWDQHRGEAVGHQGATILPGCGLATVCMLIYLHPVVERLEQEQQGIRYHVVTNTVDDLALLLAGVFDGVLRGTVSLLGEALEALAVLNMRLSDGKNVVLANRSALGRAVLERLPPLAFRADTTTRLLGMPATATRHRRVTLLRARLRKASCRRVRFRALRKAGLRRRFMMRTTVNSVGIWGASALGVAPGVLNTWRSSSIRAGLSFGQKAKPAWYAACALAAQDLDPAYALHESMYKEYSTLCASGRVQDE
eukprot:6471383-Amphidinium_carterae.1